MGGKSKKYANYHKNDPGAKTLNFQKPKFVTDKVLVPCLEIESLLYLIFPKYVLLSLGFILFAGSYALQYIDWQ